MKPPSLILAVFFLVGSWYYALSISSTGGVAFKSGQPNDFFQLWSASRAILHRIDPYGPEVTKDNQIAVYGTTAAFAGGKDDRRLEYPIIAAFPILPLGLFGFRIADTIAVLIMAALIFLCVGWLRGVWTPTTILYVLFTFSSYPVIVGLQMRQPTLLFLAIAIASFALARSGYLTSAGFMAVLACGKPHVAFPILLPLLIWALADWPVRKRFVSSFTISALALFTLGNLLVPGWFREWLSFLHGYSQFAPPSVLVHLLGPRIGIIASLILTVGLTVSLWINRRSDLGLQVAFSTTVFCLIIQGQLYNMALLLVSAIWVADHAADLERSGVVSQVGLTVTRIAFLVFWTSTAIGGVLMHLNSPSRSIAWSVAVTMISPVLLALLGIMLAQIFCAGDFNEVESQMELYSASRRRK